MVIGYDLVLLTETQLVVGEVIGEVIVGDVIEPTNVLAVGHMASRVDVGSDVLV